MGDGDSDATTAAANEWNGAIGWCEANTSDVGMPSRPQASSPCLEAVEFTNALSMAGELAWTGAEADASASDDNSNASTVSSNLNVAVFDDPFRVPAGLIPDGQHRPPTSRRTGTFQLHPGEAPAGLLPPFEGWLDKTSGGKEVGGGKRKRLERWDRRWFVLERDSSMLRYYRSASALRRGERPLGEVRTPAQRVLNLETQPQPGL